MAPWYLSAPFYSTHPSHAKAMHTFTAPGDSIDPKLLHYWTFHIFKACYIIFRHYHLAVLCWNKQGCSSASDSSSSRVVSPIEGVIEEMQSKIRRLERWLAINTVLPNPYSKVLADFFPMNSPHLSCFNYFDTVGRFYGHFWCLPSLVIHCIKGSVNNDLWKFSGSCIAVLV